MGLAAILVAGCTITLDRRQEPDGETALRSPADSGATAPATPVDIPFIPAAYPPDGEAPCAEAETSDPSLLPYGGTLRRIVALDEKTIVFDLCDRDVAFRSKVASPSLVINDTSWLEARIEASAGLGTIARELNGTGPFRLDAWNDGSELILSRFDEYRGPTARSRALVFRWEADQARRLEAIIDGIVDGIDAIDSIGASTVQGNPEMVAHARAGMNVMYLGMNSRFAPFDLQAVRQAIGRGIDRQALLGVAFPPGTTLASHLTPCSVPNGCAGSEWWETDVPTARDLLAQAGFPDGFSTTIRYSDEPRDYLPNPTAVATELRRQLAENLGIETELQVLPFDELVSLAERGQLDGINLLGARGRYPDPTAYLDPRLGTGAPEEFGAVDVEIRKALAKGAATANDSARTKAYTTANDRIRSLAPLIPIAHVGSVAAVRADVMDFRVSPTNTERFAAVTPGDRSQFVWMQVTEPDGLYCPDETAPDAMRVCAQVFEGLYGFTAADATPVAALAQECRSNDEMDVWTCTLRSGVVFHDGARLDANDVLVSYAVQWDAAHPLHGGGTFQAFTDRFGPFLNTPAGS